MYSRIYLDALEAALSLPYPAFFLNLKKEPLPGSRGFYDACEGDALKRLHRRYPGELIGVPTGPASGFSVLDVDSGKPGDIGKAARWWCSENRSRLPRTRMHETQSGGIHLLFRHREGLKCSASKIAAGIDVRGELGYIVWWPAAGFSVVDNPLADWPDWLRPPEPPKPEPYRFTGPVNASRYGAAALGRACAAIRGAADGAQEATLNRECFSIGSLVAGGVIERTGALGALLSVARSMASYDPRRPWTAREIDTKVTRSFDQGQRQPRTPVRRVA
jgi:hypothetical protein